MLNILRLTFCAVKDNEAIAAGGKILQSGELKSYTYEFSNNSDIAIVFINGFNSLVYKQINYFSNLAKSLNIDVITYENSFKLETTESEYVNLLNTVVEKYKNKYRKICFVARCLGCAILAKYLEDKNYLQPVIFISPFKDLKTIGIVPNITGYKFECSKYLNNENYPVQIIYEGLDEMVFKSKFALEVYERLNNKSYEPIRIENCNHGKILDHIPTDIFRKIL